MQTTHLEIIASLNRQLEDANAELRGALRSGIDPLKTRRRIKTIEANRDSAIQRAAQASEDDRRRLTEEAAQQGEPIAVEIITRVSESLKPFNITKDHFMTHPINEAYTADIRAAANHLALCRVNLARALDAHAVALDEVQTLQDRISSIESRRTAITAARLAGTNDVNEVNEFLVLAADADELRKMLVDAKRVASELVPTQPSEAVLLAEKFLQRTEDEATLAELKARARDIEGVLLGAVRALRDVGTKLGHRHLGQSYSAGSDLRWLISNGALKA